MPAFKEELANLIVPFLDEVGAVLIDVHFSRGRHKSFLRLLVDKKEGGISVEELASLNEKIGKALDEQNLISNSYILEVSSPGLDRPLMGKDDFLRCRNRRVRIMLKEAMQGFLELQGIVVDIKESSLVVQHGDALLEVPLDAIVKGYQVIGAN